MLHRLRFVLLALVMLCVVTAETRADDLLVFVSAFAKGDDGAIHSFRLDTESGELKLVRRTTDVEHPFFLALSPKNHFLYSIHAPEGFGGEKHERVAAYRVEGRTGELTRLNDQSAKGSAACYLDVDSTGQAVVLANYTTGSVAAFPVRDDGSLGEASSFMQHEGSSVNETRQKEPHAHCFVISPDNRFAYAADLGTDQIFAYRLDSDNAKLTANTQPFVRTPPGAGPRHLTFHPNGKHVYVINELLNTISVFDYDADTGMLVEQQEIATLPADFDGTSHTADLKITPDGRYLYGTNRGHDSIASYRIADDGRLQLLSIDSSLGGGPQNLAITPCGNLLICANMAGGNVVVFRLDDDGKLTSVGEPFEMPGPSCVMIVH